MKLIEDVNNKLTKHNKKNRYFEANGIEVERIGLPIGDYIMVTDKVQDVLDRKSKRGIAVKKMDLLGSYTVCVDTKYGIEELVTNICGKQHERFRDECILAQNNGVKLIILVENDGGKVGKSDAVNPVIRKVEDLHKWINPRLFIMKRENNGKWVQKYPSATKGQRLMKACMSMTAKYGVEFQFCSSKESGEKIIEILKDS